MANAGSWDWQYNPPQPSNKVIVEYMAHVQGFGDSQFETQPSECGTTGQSRRLEGFLIRLQHESDVVGLRYKAHLQGLGDTGWVFLNEFVGTRDSVDALRLSGLN